MTAFIRRIRPRHPMRPVQWDGAGVIRFKGNPIVRFLLDNNGKFNLNNLHSMSVTAGFTKDDWAQFNQLIGYSVSGCPLYSDKLQAEADAAAEELVARQPRDPKRRKKKGT